MELVMKQERGNRNRLQWDKLFCVSVWQHKCLEALKSWILQAIDKDSWKESLYFPSLVCACLSGSWCWHSSPFKIQHACCICQLPFVSVFVKNGEKKPQKGIWEKTDRLRQAFGCSAIQDLFALLAPLHLEWHMFHITYQHKATS